MAVVHVQCRRVKIFETGFSPREAKPKESQSVRMTPDVARANSPGTDQGSVRSVRYIGHDCQSMAYGDASDEQVDVPNRSACAAQERLEAATLLRSELINEQYLRRRRGAQARRE